MSIPKIIDHIKVKQPSKEEIDKRCQIRYEASKLNKNQFGYWFPTVVKVLDDPEYQFGVKYPRTKTVDFAREGSDAVLSESMEAVENSPSITAAVQMIEKAFDDFGTQKLFIKNSLFSSKHSWDSTCFVTKNSDIRNQVSMINYEWFFGCSDYPVEFVVRELIPTKPVFHAFSNMPITQEYRLFSDDGETYAYQPYWPLEAFKRCADVEDIEHKLATISGEPDNELMSAMVETANLVTKELTGDWSVDFLIGEDGKPWLIDMALARDSYHSDDLRVISK